MLPFKGIGLMLLFLSIAALGVFAAQNLDDRAKLLDTVCVSINRYKTLMMHSGQEISKILPESFKNLKIVTFSGTRAVLNEKCPLKREDIKLLESFFESVGTESKSGEVQKCDMYTEAFRGKRKEAFKTAKEKKKIYLVSGFCIAFAAVVIFI